MFWRLIPRPRSETSSRTCPFRRSAETRTPVPAGVWTSALSSRIRSTCATRSGSQSSSIGSSGRSSRTRDVVPLRGRRELAGDLARELADVGRLRPQLERAGLQPREVEQLGGELAHAVDLAAQLVEELAPRLLVEVLVGQQLEEAAEREDRRAQLVRGGGDELLARPVEPRELVLHVVERGRELAQLVVGVGADRVREVAGGDLAGGLLEPADALRQRARHEVAGQQRDRQRDAAGEQDLAADQVDVALDLVERVGEHRDALDLVVLDQRVRDDRLAAGAGRQRCRDAGRPRRDGLERQRAARRASATPPSGAESILPASGRRARC